MLVIAMICFILAATLGMVLLSYVLTNKPTPKGIALIHGPVAALGIILLIIYSFFNVSPTLSLVLFLIAALGGFYLIYRDLYNKPIPKWVALIHGLIAITAFVLLIVFLLQK